MIGQSEKGTNNQIKFVTLLCGRCRALVFHFQAAANCAKKLGQNHFARSNRHVLTVLHLLCAKSLTDHGWVYSYRLTLCLSFSAYVDKSNMCMLAFLGGDREIINIGSVAIGVWVEICWVMNCKLSTLTFLV
jgi:hypothetical protein